MSSGTTTMKMISSTSTTSTSGVMLISDCRPESEPPESNCMSLSLRACTSRLGDQPDPGKTGLLDRDHDVTHLAEVELRIATDHDFRIRVCAHRLAKALAELLGCDLPIVDPQLTGLVDRDENPAPLVALLARLLGVRKVHLRPV